MTAFRVPAIVLASSVALLTGCATWSTSSVSNTPAATTANAKPEVKKLPAQVTITDTDVVDRKYESLGDISVTVNKTTAFHPNPTQELVNDKLREKAAEMGADAVVLVRYGSVGISLMSWGSLEGKGRAIKFVQ
jgi:uncharacterized protein YbjQ (UPF0145 family)